MYVLLLKYSVIVLKLNFIPNLFNLNYKIPRCPNNKVPFLPWQNASQETNFSYWNNFFFFFLNSDMILWTNTDPNDLYNFFLPYIIAPVLDIMNLQLKNCFFQKTIFWHVCVREAYFQTLKDCLAMFQMTTIWTFLKSFHLFSNYLFFFYYYNRWSNCVL